MAERMRKDKAAPGWVERNTRLCDLARRQLFFVGGAPRSGTTWLQQILNAHPDVSCHGEALFSQGIATPLDELVAQWGQAIGAKNTRLFRHTGGFPPPLDEDADFLLGTGVLLALARSSADGRWRAVGEKTPENVFLFPRLQRLFPEAKFIGIARDPRDALTSAWHFFQERNVSAEEMDEKKKAFIQLALPAMGNGMRTMIAMAGRDPDHYRNVTYEALIRDPAPAVAGLFRFLGVSDAGGIVADCLEATSFARQTSGRRQDEAQNGVFLRKGMVGDWPSTLTAEMNTAILNELGWAFPHFGWTR